MQLPPNRQQNRTMSKQRLRLAFLGVLIVSAILHSVSPAPGLAHEAGELIQICGEFGVSEIRIDADGNEIDDQAPPCARCGDCPLCVVVAEFGPTDDFAWQVQSGERRLNRARANGFHVQNPAQFWADNRGPPLRSEKAQLLADKKFMGPACVGGRAPWM